MLEVLVLLPGLARILEANNGSNRTANKVFVVKVGASEDVDSAFVNHGEAGNSAVTDGMNFDVELV